jgi:hypothetical protein
MSLSLFMKTLVTVTVVLLPLVTFDGTIHIGLFLFVLHPPRWSRQLGGGIADTFGSKNIITVI